jgi:hypothetical protein
LPAVPALLPDPHGSANLPLPRYMDMIRRSFAGLLFALFLPLLVLAPPCLGAVSADMKPGVPCEGPLYPALPMLDGSPNVGFWSTEDLGGIWSPPSCSGWAAAPTTFVVAVSGHFSNRSDVAGMLTHIGTITALTQVRYWSVTDKKWDALFTRATSLRGPQPSAVRGDFSADEFHTGSELYFLSADNRMQKDMVTKVRAVELGPNRIVLEMTNVAPLRWLAFTVVAAGDLQTLYFLDRESAVSWRFYSVTRVLNGGVLSRIVTGPSYVNRAVAMFRHIAGIASDRDPPAMR